ncbi:MAG TPA: hypothetical protein VF797_18995 [Noviherbaspirillum sp.]
MGSEHVPHDLISHHHSFSDYQYDFYTNQRENHDTSGRAAEEKGSGATFIPPPVHSEDDGFELINLALYKSKARELCQSYGIEDVAKLEEGSFDKVQSSFRDFFYGLSNVGTANHGRFSPSVAEGMVNVVGGVVSGISTGVGIVRIICARLASIFQSSSGEVARTIFSGICIASTAIRTALPIALQAATAAQSLDEIVIFSVAAAVMASVYLVTSSISVYLAGHDAILSSPSTAAIAKEVRKEVNSLPNEISEDFSKAAQESLKKIGRMLTAWKANTSANLLSLGKEFLLFGGAAISAVSALSKFAPVLTVPFVSIITGSISLIANLAEMAQGIVEYRSQKAKLEELNSRNDHGPDTQIEIKKLENQLKLSKIRIAKGALNVLISVANIVFGTLTVLTSFSMPVVPAILTAVSLTTVLVLSVAGLVVRKVNAGTAAENTQRAANLHSADQDTDTNETESDDERKQERDRGFAYV